MVIPERGIIAETQGFKEMLVYPMEGSEKASDGCCVVKFGELKLLEE